MINESEEKLAGLDHLNTEAIQASTLVSRWLCTNVGEAKRS
ncbi:hypothetical protein OOU_Y34scaffold00162g80 [Pyricularia oryzae Y34]|uniref:Uncharacterized protein n=3 Tax=Pyricularia oryzae TaxID=318829 RepID=A0A4P7N6M3_PYROR|nr:hypothetical protein OOU_Y34scaffold00162g80 [Pyricularia oryzae Y34]QBZ56506.1 hypothetical protein PoMZ_01415 [Pyricularia oryzae]